MKEIDLEQQEKEIEKALENVGIMQEKKEKFRIDNEIARMVIILGWMMVFYLALGNELDEFGIIMLGGMGILFFGMYYILTMKIMKKLEKEKREANLKFYEEIGKIFKMKKIHQ